VPKVFLWVDLRETDHLEDPGEDGRMILKRMFKKLNEGHELNLSGSGQVADYCECSN